MNKLTIKESKVLVELREIRENLYEETKHLSPDDFTERMNKRTTKILKKYNINLPNQPENELLSLKELT